MLLIYSNGSLMFGKSEQHPDVQARPFVYSNVDLVELFATYLPQNPLLILEGGADVNPRLYNEPNIHSWYNKRRDEEEGKIYGAALANDIPILGICRGHQLLNVLQGGTLYQDLGLQHPGGAHQGVHAIKYTDLAIENGFAKMQESFRYGPGVVNSYHHQGIKDLAPSAQVLATHKGLIEAVLYPRALSVQWHPEFEDHWDILTYAEELFYGNAHR